MIIVGENGDMTVTKILVVEAGAQFDGQSKMSEKETSRPVQQAQSSGNEKQG